LFSKNSIEQFEFALRISRPEGNNEMRDPVTAGVLSFLIPGVGQLYNGRILAGILWLIITPGFWIGTGGTLGWVCHIIAAYTAYSYAKDHPIRV
jgi:TM2 domain-containing membrane protein YozV